jgi:Na+-translocating ferredoxin:NAD+ oxidoreductase RnfC subunit
LFPKEACDQAKVDLRTAGIRFVQEKPVRVHPMKDYRRVPLSMLRKRLKVEEYESDTPFDAAGPQPSSVRLKLQQHAGQPAKPVVREGDTVRVGSPVARVEPAELGATIHSSLDGRVTAITPDWIEVQA